MMMLYCRRIPSRCPWQIHSLTRSDLRRYTTSSEAASSTSDGFGDHAGDLQRRKRKVDQKRRQHGASFIDHAVITVRGGQSVDVPFGFPLSNIELTMLGP